MIVPPAENAVDWKRTDVLIGIVQLLTVVQVDLPVVWTTKLQLGVVFPPCGNNRDSAERSSMATLR